MSQIYTSVQLYAIVRMAVASLGDSTTAQRQEIYSRTRETILSLDRHEESERDAHGIYDIEELDIILERIELEYLANQTSVVPLQKTNLIIPDSAAEIVYPSNPDINSISGDRSHYQTTLMLKNLGAGGTVSIIKILIQLVLLPLMAHLLGPKEFGIYALTVPIVAFMVMISDGGVGLSLARDRTNAPEIWSTAFWLVMSSGIVMSVVVIASGYLLALASSEPRLNSLMLILSMGFPFLSLAVLPIARLTRSGNLVACSIADLSSTLAGAVCAVGCGIMGLGAMSLAFQSLTSCIVKAAIVNLYAFERPTAVFRPSAMLSHLSSGGILMGGRITDLACRSLESLLFGNAFGAAGLGAYNFATQVPRFLFEALSNPSWSALYAQSLGEEHHRRNQIFYKICRLVAFVSFPTAAFLAAASPEILAQVLGSNWQQAGMFMRILAPGYALSLTASLGTALLLALNANLVFFLTAVLLSLGRVTAIAAGYYLPVQETVWLVTFANIIYALVVFSFVVRISGAKVRDIVRNIIGSFVSALLSGLVCWGILVFAGASLIVLCAAFLAAVLCYFLAMIIIEGQSLKNEFLFLSSTLSELLKKGR